MRARRRIGWVIGALALAACGSPPPGSSAPESPAAPAGTAAPAGGAAPSGAAAPGAAPAAPPPTAASFDVGEIKTAAEYLREPEFAAANLERGELLSLACAACHTLRAGQPKLIGPNLHGVFGRRAASVPDFDYSPGLEASNLVWTPRALEAWLADPARFVTGTTMTFSGYRDPGDRRDLIAFLLQATQ